MKWVSYPVVALIAVAIYDVWRGPETATGQPDSVRIDSDLAALSNRIDVIDAKMGLIEQRIAVSQEATTTPAETLSDAPEPLRDDMSIMDRLTSSAIAADALSVSSSAELFRNAPLDGDSADYNAISNAFQSVPAETVALHSLECRAAICRVIYEDLDKQRISGSEIGLELESAIAESMDADVDISYDRLSGNRTAMHIQR